MKRLSIILLILFSTFSVFGQQKDSLRNDSLLNVQLSQTEDLLKQKEKQTIVDSLRRQALLDELKALSSDDEYRRSILETQLQKQAEEDSIRRAKLMESIQELKKSTKGFPISPFKDTLFHIYTRIASFSVSERAQAINKRLIDLSQRPTFCTDSIKLSVKGNGVDLIYFDVIIMSITEADGIWLEKPQQALAQEYLSKIKTALVKEREQNSLQIILKEISFTCLLIIGVLLMVFLVNRTFRALKRYLIKHKTYYFKGFKIKETQLLDADRHLRVALVVNNGLRIVFILLFLYLALPILFSIFPTTRGYAEILINWILSPAQKVFWGIIGYLPNLFTILVIYYCVHYSLRFLHFLATEIEKGDIVVKGFYPDWAMHTYTLVRILLYAFMFIVIFPYLPGSNSPVFQGVSVFLGILFSMGSSSAISNAVAGFVITYMRPFKVGDRIKIGEITGDVVAKGLLVTHIRTIKNEDIIVPNANILSSHTINYSTMSGEEGLILHTTVTIGYDVPWPTVHKLLINAALATPGIMQDKKPFVLQTSLDDFYVSYQLNAYTHEPNQMIDIYAVLHQNIQNQFNENNVEILSPHYRAMRDGNMTTIPKDYLPEDYVAPRFRVGRD